MKKNKNLSKQQLQQLIRKLIKEQYEQPTLQPGQYIEIIQSTDGETSIDILNNPSEFTPTKSYMIANKLLCQIIQTADQTDEF